jgi:type II secretory pathway component GspD/PulD (secretin)
MNSYIGGFGAGCWAAMLLLAGGSAWAQAPAASGERPASPGLAATLTEAAPVGAGAVRAAPPLGGAEFISVPERAPVLPPGAKLTTTTNLISVTLDDVSLEDVVRMFTRISGANIIASASNLTGRVTVNLTDVQWKPALQSILDMHGLTLIEKTPGTEVYSIVTRGPDQEEPKEVKTLFLKYASVREVGPLVSNMLSVGGSVMPFPSRNVLVVKTTLANHSEIASLVSDIDRLREQVFIEAKFMELGDGAIKDLGINWQVLEGYGASVGTLALSTRDERKRSALRTDKGAAARQAGRYENVNEQYDLYGTRSDPGTVEIISRPDGSFIERSIPHQITDLRGNRKASSTDIQNDFDRDITDIRTAILSADDFRLVLSALKQMSGVSIVSNPKIIVANEEPAIIHVGKTQRPFIASVIPATQTTGPLVTYNPGEPVDEGVKLTVVPTINTRSNITVRIEPELSSWEDGPPAPNGQTYPIVVSKKVKTVFCLENGRTVAIGGLTKSGEKQVEKKVPLLGDIPILGRFLFSHSHTEKSQDETIIFVTVGLASPQTIREKDGLPREAELVHRKLLQSDGRLKQLDDMIQKLEGDKAREKPLGEGK